MKNVHTLYAWYSHAHGLHGVPDRDDVVSVCVCVRACVRACMCVCGGGEG